MKLEDLKCEFCDGQGEKEINVDGMDCPSPCSFCNETGIDQDQLKKAFLEMFSTTEPCAYCGCSLDSHNSETMNCPSIFAGQFYGWLETKFMVR